MIDTHVHLAMEDFNNDRDEVIARFFDEGGKALITIGVGKESNKRALEIAYTHENVFCALGFHPTDEKGGSIELSDEDEKKLQENLGNKRVVAVGEIGLDYFWDKTEKGRNIQKETFVRQIKIAAKVKLPVIIHCRNAYADVYNILKLKVKSEKSKVVIHCYGGSIEDTRRFLELENVHFSFTGNITFEKHLKQSSTGAKLRKEIFDAIRMIPLERIMAETDSPLLAPVPHRGRRNEPCYVKYVLEKLANLKQISVNKAEKITDQNAINFFDLHL